VTGTKFSRKKPNSPYSINQPHTYFKIQLIIKSTYPLRICLVYFSGRRTMPRDTTHRCNSKQNVPSPWPVAAQKGQISTRERERAQNETGFVERERTRRPRGGVRLPSFRPARAPAPHHERWRAAATHADPTLTQPLERAHVAALGTRGYSTAFGFLAEMLASPRDCPTPTRPVGLAAAVVPLPRTIGVCT
jgi:hypothetical protein